MKEHTKSRDLSVARTQQHRHRIEVLLTGVMFGREREPNYRAWCCGVLVSCNVVMRARRPNACSIVREGDTATCRFGTARETVGAKLPNSGQIIALPRTHRVSMNMVCLSVIIFWKEIRNERTDGGALQRLCHLI